MTDYDIVDPRFRSMVLPNAPLEKLADGFLWTEGPVWFGDHQCLLFSDLPRNRLMRWSDVTGLSVFRAPSGFANGNTRDRSGRLVSCLHGARSLVRTELDGQLATLADRRAGHPLNAPNDVVCKSDGSLWFTDPVYGLQADYEGGRRTPELAPALCRLDPDTGDVSVISEDFVGPNGLCFSPDESRLYVTETGLKFDPASRRIIRVFDVAQDGRTLGEGRDFYKVSPGDADGIRCDEEGNVWCSAGDGVHCVAADGRLIGRLRVPCGVQNLCFGDRHASRLFLCAAQSLYAIWVNRRGAQWP